MSAAEGFFLDDLGSLVLGHGWYEGGLSGDAAAPPSTGAAAWMHASLLDPNEAARVRTAFEAARPFRHAFVEGPLDDARAAALHDAARAASFTVRDDIGPGCRVSIAYRQYQRASALTAFVDWLGSRPAASFHFWLAGGMVPYALETQVQVARFAAGDALPAHEPVRGEGLVAMYDLTRAWDSTAGGLVGFPRPPGSGPELITVPSRFNTLFLFRPAGAPYGVSAVRPEAAAGACRSVVSAFYGRRAY